MRWGKVGVVSLLLVALLVASCAPAPGPSGSEVWETILEIGSLGFLCKNEPVNLFFGLVTIDRCNREAGLIALMRILIGILVFALLYMGTSAVPGLNQNRNIAITVSLILAVMSVIFIPESVLIGIGSAYATIISVILIGAPIVGGLLLFRMIPVNSRGGIGMRIIMLLLLIFVLTAVKNYAGGLV